MFARAPWRFITILYSIEVCWPNEWKKFIVNIACQMHQTLTNVLFFCFVIVVVVFHWYILNQYFVWKKLLFVYNIVAIYGSPSILWWCVLNDLTIMYWKNNNNQFTGTVISFLIQMPTAHDYRNSCEMFLMHSKF